MNNEYIYETIGPHNETKAFCTKCHGYAKNGWWIVRIRKTIMDIICPSCFKQFKK